jgi:hypothetical protein
MPSMNRPITEIFSDFVADLTGLVRKEGQLARAEISEKLNRALTGLALMVGGSVLLIPALVILLQAAMAALVENGMSSSAASLIVGAAALVLGLVLALLGWRMMRPASLVPDRTIDQLQRDVGVARHAAGAVTSDALRQSNEQEAKDGYDPKRAA